MDEHSAWPDHRLIGAIASENPVAGAWFKEKKNAYEILVNRSKQTSKRQQTHKQMAAELRREAHRKLAELQEAVRGAKRARLEPSVASHASLRTDPEEDEEREQPVCLESVIVSGGPRRVLRRLEPIHGTGIAGNYGS